MNHPAILALQARLRQFWAAREPRERYILIAGASVLAMVVYVLLVTGLQQRIATLHRKLPELLIDSYEMAGTRTPESQVRPGGDLRSDIFGVLASRKVQAELRALGSDQVEMRLTDQEAKTLIDQLHAIRTGSGSRVASLQIRASDPPGLASATVILERKQ